jgi:hypothetical protein
MASEEVIVRRRAQARIDLAEAEARVADVCGVSVVLDSRSPDPEIAAIQQIERVTALLNAVADAHEVRQAAPPATVVDAQPPGPEETPAPAQPKAPRREHRK